jgi:hypothetical protein
MLVLVVYIAVISGLALSKLVGFDISTTALKG